MLLCGNHNGIRQLRKKRGFSVLYSNLEVAEPLARRAKGRAALTDGSAPGGYRS